jgi:hypothetical protein
MQLGFYMQNSWYVADFVNRRKLEFLSCGCELLREKGAQYGGLSITVLGVVTSGQVPFAHLQRMLRVCPVQMWLFKNAEFYKEDTS